MMNDHAATTHPKEEATEPGARLPEPVRITEQRWPEGTVPVVSICCTTYNHERFIRECLDGFLMQETTFPVEILIHDDASTDTTQDIIREYETRYPSLIKPIYQTENQYSKGIKPNWNFNFPRARAQYIALCEGDDYWTNPKKLQKQVDFLEKNKDFVICYHDVFILQNGNFIESHVPLHDHKEYLTITDLAQENCIHTPSCLFKRHPIDSFSEVFASSPVGDYVLHMFNAQFGKIKRLPEKMAIYRRHPGGVWAGRNKINKLASWLDVLNLLILYFNNDKEVLRELKKQKNTTLINLFNSISMENDLDILTLVLSKVNEDELIIIFRYIAQINAKLKYADNNFSNIDYLDSKIRLNVAIRLVLAKLKKKFLNINDTF